MFFVLRFPLFFVLSWCKGLLLLFFFHKSVSPIRGPMFLCVNCVEYTLCSSCHTKEMEEGDNSSTHASAHVFALIHRPISIRISSPERLRDNLNLNTNNDTSSARPLDSLFAVELVVENKHYNFATELYFLTGNWNNT